MDTDNKCISSLPSQSYDWELSLPSIMRTYCPTCCQTIEKVKIQSTVSTECILLLYYC